MDSALKISFEPGYNRTLNKSRHSITDLPDVSMNSGLNYANRARKLCYQRRYPSLMRTRNSCQRRGAFKSDRYICSISDSVLNTLDFHALCKRWPFHKQILYIDPLEQFIVEHVVSIDAHLTKRVPRSFERAPVRL